MSCKTSISSFLGSQRADLDSQRQTDVNKCNIIYIVIDFTNLYHEIIKYNLIVDKLRLIAYYRSTGSKRSAAKGGICEDYAN
jgi:hypothetical protein